MILFDFKCGACGLRFEKLIEAEDADNPGACPDCPGQARRLPSFGRLGGKASPGPSREQMPRSWSAVNNADPSTIAGWRQIAAKRDKLEEKYPELAGDRRPVLAHEGMFAKNPLRDGDPIPVPTSNSKPEPQTRPVG